MRNPSRTAAICAVLIAIAAVSGWIAWHRYHASGADWLVIVLFAVTVVIAPYAPVLLIQGFLLGRGKARLEAGEGRLAQWRVSAAEWDRFRAFDEARFAAYGANYLNELIFRETTPPEGVDVVVGKTGLLADGSYHVLRPLGLPELRRVGWVNNAETPGRPPDCLEFGLLYAGGRYSVAKSMALRVPIPASAYGQARIAYDHFHAKLEPVRRARPLALRNPTRTLQVCGASILASVVAVAWAIHEAGRMGESLGNAAVPMAVTMIAGGVAIVAAIIGVATLRMRPKPGSEG